MKVQKSNWNEGIKGKQKLEIKHTGKLHKLSSLAAFTTCHMLHPPCHMSYAWLRCS